MHIERRVSRIEVNSQITCFKVFANNVSIENFDEIIKNIHEKN
jgi:hypothetical protein